MQRIANDEVYENSARDADNKVRKIAVRNYFCKNKIGETRNCLF